MAWKLNWAMVPNVAIKISKNYSCSRYQYNQIKHPDIDITESNLQLRLVEVKTIVTWYFNMTIFINIL